MNKPEIILKDLIKNNFVEFERFRQGIFYYTIRQYQKKGEHEDWFWFHEPDRDDDIRYNLLSFPVPLDDIGTSTLEKKDKALTFMRWIRKAIEDKTLIEVK